MLSLLSWMKIVNFSCLQTLWFDCCRLLLSVVEAVAVPKSVARERKEAIVWRLFADKVWFNLVDAERWTILIVAIAGSQRNQFITHERTLTIQNKNQIKFIALFRILRAFQFFPFARRRRLLTFLWNSSKIYWMSGKLVRKSFRGHSNKSLQISRAFRCVSLVPRTSITQEDLMRVQIIKERELREMIETRLSYRHAIFNVMGGSQSGTWICLPGMDSLMVHVWDVISTAWVCRLEIKISSREIACNR